MSLRSRPPRAARELGTVLDWGTLVDGSILALYDDACVRLGEETQRCEWAQLESAQWNAEERAFAVRMRTGEEYTWPLAEDSRESVIASFRDVADSVFYWRAYRTLPSGLGVYCLVRRLADGTLEPDMVIDGAPTEADIPALRELEETMHDIAG